MDANAVTDRHVGIFVNYERSFSDVRARVAAYDEARHRRARRTRKREESLTHADFGIGDRLVAYCKESNGYQCFAYVEVLDSYGRGEWDSYTFIRVLHCTEPSRTGHIYALRYGRYTWHVSPSFLPCPFLTMEQYREKYAPDAS